MALEKLKDLITSGQLLLERFDPEDTVSSLLSLLNRAEVFYSQDWCPVLSEAVRLLSVPAPVQPTVPAPGQPVADSDRLFFKLLPLTVPSGAADSVQFKLALSLSQCAVIQQHPLTAGWRSDLEEALRSGPAQGPDQVLVLVQTLVSILNRNLENMDTFIRRHTLDSLCSCVELVSESGSSPD
ncbi:hypothetical protein NQD34_014606 [Periophthalmus magnuspinnatus]|nr:hypothetical protein NQD34_014606 [Periophthalmus magnuspinnatus]